MYEESFFVLMDREYYRHNIEKLTNLGIVMFENLAIDNPFGTWYLGIGRQILDINLGHSFVGKQGICGFEILGSHDNDAFNLVVLGGSTTDGTLFPFKSWPEVLMDKIAYKETGMQAVSYTTGVPAMVGAMMFLTGKWVKPGVNNVEEFDPDPFLAELAKDGLPWNESFNIDLEV